MIEKNHIVQFTDVTLLVARIHLSSIHLYAIYTNSGTFSNAYPKNNPRYPPALPTYAIKELFVFSIYLVVKRLFMVLILLYYVLSFTYLLKPAHPCS